MSEEKKSSGRSWLTIAGMTILVLAIIFGLYLGLAYILRKANNKEAEPTTATVGTSGKLTDQSLVGTWESDCLVPDPNSKWAEKHKYVIKSDGTAIHTRQDWEMADCTTTQPAGLITDQIKLSIPSAGKINQTIVSEENSRVNSNAPAPGAVMYDIYQVSGNTLEFGWGFRGDNLAYDGKTGSSESDRFTTLNSFIKYQKK